MMIGGVHVDDGQVDELATRLDRSGATGTGGKLRRALFIKTVAVRLEVFQQREVVAVLTDDCPPGLEPLYDELVRQEAFRAHHPPTR